MQQKKWLFISAVPAMILCLVATAVMATELNSADIGTRLANFLRVAPEGDASTTQFAYKAWSSYPGRYLVAHYENVDLDKLQDSMLPINIDVVEERNGKLAHVANGKHPFAIDFSSLPQIGLDTARYELKKGLVAFGLNMSGSSSQAMGGLSSTGRFLMIVDGATVRDVAGPFPTESEYGEPAPECSDCLQRTVTRGVITMSDRSTNGYRDIIFKQTEKTWIDGRTEEKSAPVTVRTELYCWDGARYQKANK